MNFLHGWHKKKKVVYLKGLYINKLYMELINRQLFRKIKKEPFRHSNIYTYPILNCLNGSFLKKQVNKGIISLRRCPSNGLRRCLP